MPSIVGTSTVIDLPLEADVGGGDLTHNQTPYEPSPDGAR